LEARKKAAVNFEAVRIRPSTTITSKHYLTLADCRAVALANNQEIRAARLSEEGYDATSVAQLRRILPKIVYTGDYAYRDNPMYGFSNILGLDEQEPIYNGLRPPFGPWVTGGGVGSWAKGREQTTARNALEMNWSPNDAVQFYYMSRNAQNQKLSAHYQRVRKTQDIFGALDQAYFRLLALQECVKPAASLANIFAGITKRLERLQRQGLVAMEQYYAARDRESRAHLLLSQIQHDIERQRNTLSRAMGISPDRSTDGGFYVQGQLELIPSEQCLSESELWDLERTSLMNRPELYQATLDYLSASNDVKRTMMRYCPEIRGFWRYTKEDDKFIYNNDYREVGVRARVDLIECFANIKDVRAAKRKRASSDRVIAGLVASTVAQVRDAALKFLDERDKALSARESLRSAEGTLLTLQRQESKGALAVITVEQAKAEVMQKKIDLIRAIGESRAALANLDAAMAINYTEPVQR